MKLYYSYISKSVVTEFEAHTELYNVIARWFYWAHPNGDFDAYILGNPERLTIQANDICFQKVSTEMAADNSANNITGTS